MKLPSIYCMTPHRYFKMVARIFGLFLVAAILFLSGGCAAPKSKPSAYFSNWPTGASPAEVGKRVAENCLPRKFRYETNPQKASLGVIYPEVIA